MPDTINLRAYLARLEEKLRTNATDEVIHHCRHILQYYPKHVDTYRLLGRALLDNARWDEATAVMRRVLAVYPDDYAAHLGLAEVYGERNQGDQAIWHLERAFEHDPNNEALLASLRDLYKRFKGADYGKIQLTAGAIARQYGRNGLYEQAIDALRRALDDNKDRVDLRLLLAQMLWGAEQPVEAAEVALDVLAVLPDCLEANRILTRLWLEEDRPSDAQRYINPIEAVDPYIALELATGTQAPDSAFTLPELDYRRFAESVLASDQPDWLQDIDSGSMAAIFSETVEAPRRPSPEPQPAASDETATEVPEDWLSDDDLTRIKPTEALPSIVEEVPEIDLRFDDRLDDIEPIRATTEDAASELRRETSSLASIYSPHDGDALPDWLAASDDEPDEQAELPQETNVDPMAWLRDSGIEIVDEEPQPIEMPDIAPLPPDDEDPMAWLRESGIEIDDEDLAKLTHEHPVVPASALEEDEDPMAWLRDSGIELDDDEPQPNLDPFETADDTPISDPAADPLGWMAAYEDEIVWGDETPATTPAATPAPDDNPNAWLYESGIEFELEDSAQPDAEAAAPETPESGDDDFGWLQDEALLEPSPDTPDVETPTDSAPAAAEADEADSLAQAAEQDNIQTGLLRRLGATAEVQETTILETDDAEADAADEFNWFSDEGGLAQAPAPQDAQAADRREAMSDKDTNLNPDWRDEDGQGADDSGSPDWLRDFIDDEEEPAATPAEPAEDVPEWLAALGPNYVQPESAEESAGAAAGWSAQDEPAEEPTPATDESDQGEDFPSWLGADEMAVSSAQEDPNPDWLRDFESEADLVPLDTTEAETEPEAEPADALVEPDIPDWLSELQPPDASGAPAPVLQDEDADEADESFSWIDQMIEQAEASDTPAEAAPVASTDDEDEVTWLPDFADAPVAGETATSDTEMPSWLNDLTEADVGGDAVSDDEVVEVETFDWESALEDAEPLDDAAPIGAFDQQDADAESEAFSWDNTFDRTAPVAPVEDDTPEWLKEFQTDAAPEAQVESESDDAAVAPVETDTPEWLKEFQTDAAPEAQVESESDDATVVTVQPGEQPEWLAEMFSEQAEAETPEEPEPVEAISEFDEFDFAESEEADVPVAETEHVPASNAPDWLNAMVPGVDLDYAPEADEIAEPEPEAPVSERRRDRDFEWLVDIVEEETQPAPGPAAAEPEAPRFSFSKLPAWLRGKQATTGDKND